MAQLMPLPLPVSCFSKIQIGFTFLVPAHPGSARQRAVKRVCVCVLVLLGNYDPADSTSVPLRPKVTIEHIPCQSNETIGMLL